MYLFLSFALSIIFVTLLLFLLLVLYFVILLFVQFCLHAHFCLVPEKVYRGSPLNDRSVIWSILYFRKKSHPNSKENNLKVEPRKWNKPITGQIPHDPTYMRNLK